MAAGEFELIRRWFTRAPCHPGVILGVGDDGALLAHEAGRELAVTTDALVAGVHFFPDADPEALGHKALAVNLSDLAAMGAEPRWFTLALSLPVADEAWLAAFARGLWRLAEAAGIDLVGGDTTRAPQVVATVTAAGVVPAGLALRRAGARPGDRIYCSGDLGGAAQVAGAVDAVPRTGAGAAQGQARGHHAGGGDGGHHLRGAGGVAAHQVDARRLRQAPQAAGEGRQPSLVGHGQGQGEGEPARLGAHGGQVGEVHRQSLVPQGLGVGIGEEVHPGHQGIGGDGQFPARLMGQEGAVVPHPQDHPGVTGGAGEPATDEFELTGGHGRRCVPPGSPPGAVAGPACRRCR